MTSCIQVKEVEQEDLTRYITASEGVVKWNFDGCSLGTLGQLWIGVIRDHQGLVNKEYSKPASHNFTIEAKIAVLLEGIVPTKDLCFSNFVVEGIFLLFS